MVNNQCLTCMPMQTYTSSYRLVFYYTVHTTHLWWHKCLWWYKRGCIMVEHRDHLWTTRRWWGVHGILLLVPWYSNRSALSGSWEILLRSHHPRLALRTAHLLNLHYCAWLSTNWCNGLKKENQITSNQCYWQPPLGSICSVDIWWAREFYYTKSKYLRLALPLN